MKELNVNEMNETGDPCKYNIYIYIVKVYKRR